jgi:hypothetical protein
MTHADQVPGSRNRKSPPQSGRANDSGGLTAKRAETSQASKPGVIVTTTTHVWDSCSSLVAAIIS